MPKIVPKSVQTCFEDVLGWFFRKNFLPSVPWWVESSKIFKKIKKVSKFQKCPKSFQKVSQRVLNKFRGDFFEKVFCTVFHGGSSLRKFSKKSKNFQKSKHAQNRSQKCPNVFWSCFRVIFSKKLFAQCSMVGRVFENFKKIKKVSKFQKCPKSFQKVSQRVLNKFRGDFFEKNFCPVFQGGSSLRKFSKKSKNFQKSKHALNRSQKCPNVFWRCFGVIFLKKIFAQCSMEGRVFENFQKNQKNFKIPKMPKIIPKSVQTCFEDVLGWFFRKNFLPSVPWWVECSKNFKKNQKIFKIPIMP